MFAGPTKDQRIEPWIQYGRETKERYDVLLGQGVPHDVAVAIIVEHFRWILNIPTPKES